ncbi:MAG: hypothetical protein ABIZ91_18370 [Gemmatimonadaceae bacterium]
MPGILRTIRTLLRTPAFTVAALIALGLGMGASAAIYTLIQRVVLDPIPYPHAEQLVWLKNAVPGVAPGEEWQLSLAQYVHFGRRLRSIERIGIFRVDGMNFAGVADPRRVREALISYGPRRTLHR